MAQIVPTITASTPDEYAVALARLSFAPRIHIDISNGDFAPSQTVNLNQIYWDIEDDVLKTVDLHLMLQRPAEWLHQIVSLNPDLVILHAEIYDSDENLPRIFDHLRKFNIKVGMALLPDTTVDSVKNLIKLADHVMIFGGHLGFQGGAADLSQLDKAKEVKAINPNIEIAWDGGANIDNVTQIATAGIDVINVGAAISHAENPAETYEKLSQLC